MPESDGELHPDEREVLVHSRVRVRNAGGLHSRHVLVANYFPRKGQMKKVQSNHKKYGKSWATAEEITKADKLAFLAWIENGLSNKGVGGSGNARAQPSSLASARSSARIANNIRSVCIGAHSVVHIEEAVVQCVRYLVHTVARQARCLADRPLQQRVNHVAGKRRNKTSMASRSSACARPLLMTRRMKAAKLTQRKRESKGYLYRSRVLYRAAAARLEEDLDWLHIQKHRLATIVAQQDLQKLLPEGAAATELLVS